VEGQHRPKPLQQRRVAVDQRVVQIEQLHLLHTASWLLARERALRPRSVVQAAQADVIPVEAVVQQARKRQRPGVTPTGARYRAGMTELRVITTPPSGIALVEAFLDALKALDVERALGMLSDDIVYQNVPLPPDRGKRAVERTLRRMMKLVREFDVHMHNIAERDGVVLTERTDIGRGPLLDVEFWVCGTFELENGKIKLWRDRFDVASLLLQLATSPLRRLF
jgi:limonene-1,2-epoxide hydrolase